MKSLGKISEVRPHEAVTPIEGFFSQVLGLQKGTVLQAVALNAQEDDPAGRLLALLLTPFPRSSWGRLIRFSATIDPGIGSLYQLFRRLEELGIYPRHIEEVTGAGLPPLPFRSDGAPAALAPAQEEGLPPTAVVRPTEIGFHKVVLPGVKITIELPQVAYGAHETLQQLLIDLIKKPPRERSTEDARVRLETALSSGGYDVGVEWISPMATLNRLGEATTLRAEKIEVEKIEVVAVPDPPGGAELGLGLEPWLREHWRGDAFDPDDSGRKILLLPAVDSDEQVLVFHFFRHSDRLVIQFSVRTPTLALEQLWWRYICASVKDADGTILGAQSTARVLGAWGVIEVTAAFPLASRDGGDAVVALRKILGCFRKLQGDRSFTSEFECFKKDLATAKNDLGTLLFGPSPASSDRQLWSAHWEQGESLTKSQLEKLSVIDPLAGAAGPRYPGVFGNNPFGYTSPMNRNAYAELYGPEDDARDKRSRLRTAGRIVEKLEQGENVAVVGAHRTGKTTLLSLVYDLLRKPEENVTALATEKSPPLLSRVYDLLRRPAEGVTDRATEKSPPLQEKRGWQRDPGGKPIGLVPVWINAAVTPPLFFLTQVVYELRRHSKERRLAPQLIEAVSTLADDMDRALSKITFNLGFVQVDVEQPLPAASPGVRGAELTNLQRRLVKETPAIVVAEFLRRSLNELRKLVDGLDRSAIDLRLVLLIDEFSESLSDALPWGDARALAVWRHVIEAPEFHRIRWIFSTSQPVSEATDYSPLTNSLVEVTVGALAKEEAHALIDAFSVRAWRQEQRERRARNERNEDRTLAADGQAVAVPELLWPVITFQARTFLISITGRLPYLLQVACYHIFERATQLGDFPLINKLLCRQAILGKVLAELSDYFEVQWRRVPSATATKVEDSVRRFVEAQPRMRDETSLTDRFLRAADNWRLAPESLPPGSLKTLERFGLRAEGGSPVAPLVAAWLLSRGTG